MVGNRCAKALVTKRNPRKTEAGEGDDLLLRAEAAYAKDDPRLETFFRNAYNLSILRDETILAALMIHNILKL